MNNIKTRSPKQTWYQLNIIKITPKKNKLETVKETEEPVPVKKKRELSEKQKANFAKLREYQKAASRKKNYVTTV